MRLLKLAICVLVVFTFALTTPLVAQNHPSYKTIYKFQGAPDGELPYGPLVEHNGSFYGITIAGGVPGCGGSQIGCGSVYQLTPPSSEGGAWTETTIYAFQGSPDGQNPWGPLSFDSNGNLYGTTSWGGSGIEYGDGAGIVYRLSPPSTAGGAWTETILYNFQGGNDGAFPTTGVVIDSAGNLFGTTDEGGGINCNPYDCGTVFELSPPAVSGGAWTETLLHSFTDGSDGATPSTLILANSGVLYGAAERGGNSGNGVVFQLTPSGGSYAFNVIYDFGLPTDGGSPYALALHNGFLYGVNDAGPGVVGSGTVFRLSRAGGVWTNTTLYTFPFADGANGSSPNSKPVFDNAGNIYGTTYFGGYGLCDFGCGTVYELSPSEGGYNETVVHSFEDHNEGSYPEGVIMYRNALYGSCYEGGGGTGSGFGTAFVYVP
jgi:hypothetical protein